jgi:spore coat polysaccharide biosynthesis protein SpsF (cytidylyltransferase family)/aryl-alcohol dehydrogenase-like predicted oxidoreductase
LVIAQAPVTRQVRVVLQARTSSSRLPAKVLLPIGGLPLAVLVARRAMRNGADLVVATSADPSDDLLASELRRYDLPTLRGPLEDVLGRFILATADLPDDALCVRLTTDNAFPDADLVAQLVKLLIAGGHSYMDCADNTRLPYGMSAEIFTVAALRDAAAATDAPYDREHVTPYIMRNHHPAVCPVFSGLDRDWGHLRCTIDTFDDYSRVARVFGRVADPVAVPWQRLIEHLQALPGAPAFSIKPGAGGPAGMVLGTVQLGIPYGRANVSGMPSETMARAIVLQAIEHGVAELDTARAYGCSENRLGRILAGGWTSRATLLTKLDPLARLCDDLPTPAVHALVDASVLGSCHALRLSALPVLMHRAAHLESTQGRVWRRLLELKQAGLIERLGLSVQSPAELRRALAVTEVEHVQLPYNILDWRWAEYAGMLAARPDMRVHVRSVFLQGLLTPAAPERWPAIPDVDATETVAALNRLVQALNRESVRDLCIAFVRSRSWVHGVVVGVETLEQLHENLGLFRRPPLTPAEAEVVRDRLPRVPETLLNPALWPTT